MSKVTGTITRLGVTGTITRLGVTGTITRLGVNGTITQNGAFNWSYYWLTHYPSALTLTDNGELSITLNWTNNGTGYDGVKVERSVDGINYSVIATLGVVATYDDTAPADGTYFYRVRYYKGSSYSAYSNIDSIAVESWNPVLSTPSALTLSVISDTQIDGSFTINGTGQDGHKVYISSDGGATYTLNQTLTGADNTFSATGLTENTRYYFKVTAYKGLDESHDSNVSNDLTFTAFLLTATGTGAVTSSIKLDVSSDIILTLDGTARFYSDVAGTLGESTTWAVTSGALRTYYLKCPSGTANLYFSDISKVIKWGDGTNSNMVGFYSPTNAPSIGGSLSRLINATSITILATNTLSGNISGMVGLEYLTVGSNNTLTGSVTNLVNMKVLSVTGANTLSGSITGMTSLNTLNVAGSNTLSGDISGLTLLTYINIGGANTITGSVTNLVNLVTVYLFGQNRIEGDFGLNNSCNGITALDAYPCAFTTYTAGGVWSNANKIRIYPFTGYGYSSAEIDNILIDMAASGPAGETITLTGSSAPRTSASDAAVLTLQGRGCTVVTNP